MVAIVQRDPFSVLIRKIGYSVGLENTRERFGDIVEVYARDREISAATLLSELVSGRWRLSTHNVVDVLSSLNIITVNSGSIDVQFGLDAAAVLRNLIRDDDRFSVALDAVFCALILIADGDIFLNCLAADFEPEAVRNGLLRMVHSKRALAYEAIRLSALREKVDRIINIESQRGNRGSAGVGKGVNLLTRTQPLGREAGPLSASSEAAPAVSADYLRKVPPRRRDWAKSIGLYDVKGRTARGDRLLSLLAKAGVRSSDGSYALWPFLPELTALHLNKDTAPWPTLEFHDMCMVVQRAFREDGEDGERVMDAGEQAHFIELAYRQYKTLNLPKSALRNELPLRVAYLAELGWNVAASKGGALSHILYDGQLSASDTIEFRASRNNEGALVIRKAR